MSENVKRWTTERIWRCEETVCGHEVDDITDEWEPDHAQSEMEWVPASDYDALLAERDALREAGEELAGWLDTGSAIDPTAEVCQHYIKQALAAWRAATGEDA